MVICLERGADLHMARKRAVKRVCVCVCVCVVLAPARASMHVQDKILSMASEPKNVPGGTDVLGK